MTLTIESTDDVSIVESEVAGRPGLSWMTVLAVVIATTSAIAVVLLASATAATLIGQSPADESFLSQYHSDDDAGHGGDHLADVTSAAAQPPLPILQPHRPFDPAASLASFDSAVVATMVEGTLVYFDDSQTAAHHWVYVGLGFELRALSIDGTKAALVRAETTPDGAITGSELVITDRTAGTESGDSGEASVDVHKFDRLVEPEAFATDGQTLFVIDHDAGPGPGTYRVRPFDLTNGRLGAMFGPSKLPLPDDMNGLGGRQVWGQGDDRLYTLYIRQTSHGHESGESEESDHDAAHGFVHVLDLREEWAFCLDLPPTFGRGDLASTALAVAGSELAVLDLRAGSTGQLAFASTTDLAVTTVVDLPLVFQQTLKKMMVTASEQSTISMAQAMTVHLALTDSAVAVGAGNLVVWFDRHTLEPLGHDGRPTDYQRALDGAITTPDLLLGLTSGSGQLLAWSRGGANGPLQLAPPLADR